jgi:hypothetical protein
VSDDVCVAVASEVVAAGEGVGLVAA